LTRTYAAVYVDRVRAALAALPLDELDDLAAMLFRGYEIGKQVFIMGNGGSASNASHMAADLAKNTIRPNMRRFKVMSLNDNPAILTALANDIGYEHIFVEQLTNLIAPADILIVLSGSGRSANILNAIRYAQSESAQVVALVGDGDSPAAGLADLAIIVPSEDYGVIEDCHLVVNHALVEHFKRRLLEAHPHVV
jgi:D-sedoheptulose 7-phosphate isomerase